MLIVITEREDGSRVGRPFRYAGSDPTDVSKLPVEYKGFLPYLWGRYKIVSIIEGQES